MPADDEPDEAQSRPCSAGIAAVIEEPRFKSREPRLYES